MAGWCGQVPPAETSLPRRIGDAGAGREENGGVERWVTRSAEPTPPPPGGSRGRRRGEEGSGAWRQAGEGGRQVAGSAVRLQQSAPPCWLRSLSAAVL